MANTYLVKKKSCTSDSSTEPNSPNSLTTITYLHNNPGVNGQSGNTQLQNGIIMNNGNATTNGQNITSESPSPGLNNNNAPKYGTPVPNRIFVGGISAQTTESELAQLFSAYGNVKGTKIIVDRAGVSKGYGFVTFETEVEARRIMRDAQCVIFKQRKLNIAPAIKKQPFSRSLEAQSPTIGIPSTVMYANGSSYMFHNGMAFFSPPEPAPNFQAAPTSQIPSTPGATVCPTMMYPCPPGQPLYQYPYQPVHGQLYRTNQAMQYYVTPHVYSQDSCTGPLFYSPDGQVVQICENTTSADVSVPHIFTSNPVVYNPTTLNSPQPTLTTTNQVYFNPVSGTKVQTKETPYHVKKRATSSKRTEMMNPVMDGFYIDEGATGDATMNCVQEVKNKSYVEDNYDKIYPHDVKTKSWPEYEDGSSTSQLYYIMQNNGESGQGQQYVVDSGYLVESTNPTYPGNKVSNKNQAMLPSNNNSAVLYQVPPSSFINIGQNAAYVPNGAFVGPQGTFLGQNGPIMMSHTNSAVLPGSYFVPVDNYSSSGIAQTEQTPQKEKNDLNKSYNDERGARNKCTNGGGSNNSCKNKNGSSKGKNVNKDLSKDLKNLKM